MKQQIGIDIGSYAFNAAAKTVTFSGVSLVQEQILVVINTTEGTILYDLSVAAKGGILSGNVLTLTCETAGMQNTDRLAIFVDLPGVVQPVSASALPLPTGASTEATLAALKGVADTINTAAAAIKTAVESLNTKTTAVNTGAVAGTVGVNNFPAAQPVTDNGGSLTVDGPLTDTQMRATPVPISASALPLPSGAATEASLASMLSEAQSIDNKLPSLDGGRLPVILPAGGSGLTDSELRASPVETAVAGMLERLALKALAKLTFSANGLRMETVASTSLSVSPTSSSRFSILNGAMSELGTSVVPSQQNFQSGFRRNLTVT